VDAFVEYDDFLVINQVMYHDCINVIRCLIMKKGVIKKVTTGITLDTDIYEIFKQNHLVNRSGWINDVVRKELIAQGMLKE